MFYQICFCSIFFVQYVITSGTFSNIRVSFVLNGNLSPTNGIKNSNAINVTNEKLVKLEKDAIQNLPNLEILYLNDNGIQDIEAGAFNNLPKLRDFFLFNNRMSLVRNNVYNDLKSLELLDLSNNKIESIENNAFNNLTKLKELRIENNHIHEWIWTWFTNAKNLKVIKFSNNVLKTLPQELFQKGGPLSIQNIDLSRNRITEVHNGTFISSMNANVVNLSYNNLTCFPTSTSNYTKNVTYDLTYNSINCTCVKQIDEFNKKYANYSVVITVDEKTNDKCSGASDIFNNYNKGINVFFTVLSVFYLFGKINRHHLLY